MAIDFLYPFHFDTCQKSAINRLKASIDSIKHQDVNICIANTSKNCILSELGDVGVPIRYIHKWSKQKFNKPRTINFGVKQLVRSNYFILSDIDLIYQKDYVKELDKYTHSMVPYRVIPHNYNIKTKIMGGDFQAYKNLIPTCKDPHRAHYGIAPGNGLIHTKSFYQVNGYNEYFYGYSPEDADFNFRIGFINKYLASEEPNLRTIHLYHKIAVTTHTPVYDLAFFSYKKQIEEFFKGFSFFNCSQEIFNKNIVLLKVNRSREWGTLGD